MKAQVICNHLKFCAVEITTLTHFKLLKGFKIANFNVTADTLYRWYNMYDRKWTVLLNAHKPIEG